MTEEEKILSADDILASPDMLPVKVTCPEWGGVVYVRPLMSWEQGEWEQAIADAKADDKYMPDLFRARLVVKASCTPTGAPLFTDTQIKALSQKNAAPVHRLAAKITAISGMASDAVEQAEKNSDVAPDISSGSN